MYERYIKRALDVVLSAVGLVVLSPLLALIALAIRLDSPGPAVFHQKRFGKDRKLFEIYKFRTMRVDAPRDVPTNDLRGSRGYITRVGRILRMTSLDELPQLWNILKGDMSLIGPRPALWNQEDLIAEREKYGANDVKPGLTGWAQINGRDELEITEKARLDGEYVDKLNKGGFTGFIMDVRCFVGTILSVLRHDGVVEGGTGEMNKHEMQEKETVEK